jgi:hypothetical protein
MAAEAAILVQEACNASGIALSMFEAARSIREHLPSTTSVNRHPIMQLFVYKLDDLCCGGNYDYEEYVIALHACEDLVAAHYPEEVECEHGYTSGCRGCNPDE